MDAADLADRISELDHRVAACGPCVTSLNVDGRTKSFLVIQAGDVAAIRQSGIRVFGSADITVMLEEHQSNAYPGVIIHNFGSGNLVILGSPPKQGLQLQLRFVGSGCTTTFTDMGEAQLLVHDVFFRSDDQALFWGRYSTAVGVRIELHGKGRIAIVGDDCMFSSGIFVRNCDMHSLIDLESRSVVSQPPTDVIIESHVWVAQDVLLLATERVGFGSIIAAKALVKGIVPQCVVTGGLPAKILRSGVSWGRSIDGLSPSEASMLDALIRAKMPDTVS